MRGVSLPDGTEDKQVSAMSATMTCCYVAHSYLKTTSRILVEEELNLAFMPLKIIPP